MLADTVLAEASATLGAGQRVRSHQDTFEAAGCDGSHEGVQQDQHTCVYAEV